jgi:hypothetical protein
LVTANIAGVACAAGGVVCATGVCGKLIVRAVLASAAIERAVLFFMVVFPVDEHAQLMDAGKASTLPRLRNAR